MAHERFDPARAVRFDLNQGVVRLKDSVDHLLVPVDALTELWQAAGDEAVRQFGHGLGTEAARRALEGFAGDITEASPEQVLEHLGGHLALLGLGSLDFERWGKVLLAVVEHSPLPPTAGALLVAVVEAALQRTASRDVRVVPLGDEGGRQRLLVLAPAAAEKASGLLAEGVAADTVIARLNASTTAGDA